METREIDQRLQQYTAAEHRIGANLQELEQHSVYQLLTTDELEGATAKALEIVKQADPSLWDLFTLLTSSLDGARRLRGPGNRVSEGDKAALAMKLAGPSVFVSAEEIPLAERDLTGNSTREEHITVEALIDRMSVLYEAVRDVVTHAERILRDLLPRLNSAETTVSRLRTEASSLGIDTVDLDQIDETVGRMRELSLVDPLSIPRNARDAFDDALRSATARIAATRASHDELARDIAGASDLLDDCRELIARATRNRAETLIKIAQPVGLLRPPSVDAIDGENGVAGKLTPILNSTKRWQDVRRELDTWALSVTRLRSQLTRVAEANARPLEKRDELRGRLHAFRAKMAGTGNSEDFVLRDLGAEAHNELFTSPTDLVRAERLVTEFAKLLASQ